MVFRFGAFELDTVNRELRRGGQVRPLQPQAFAVLEYLVRHRDRVVPKRELLERLWPDATVTGASLQRSVSLVRAALGDAGDCVRTHSKHGYRFVATVEEVGREAAASAASAASLRPCFARSGAVHIAFLTLGEGALDIVLVPGWVFPMRAFLDHPAAERQVRELTALGRVILFDKRGTGLSDRVKDLPTLEQRMDDLRAVLDAAGSRQALLVGYSEGGPLALLYATSHPERTRGLLLVGAFARWTAAPGYGHGWTEARVEELRRYIERGWGAGETLRATVPSRAHDAQVAAWAARAEQEGSSPGAALELLEMNRCIDVRPLLPAVPVPTLVLHRTGDPVISVECGRDLAAHIPGARLVEVGGRDHLFLFEEPTRLREGVEWLVVRQQGGAERFLTTLLAAEGDGAAGQAEALEALVAQHRGARAGSGRVWCFDGPQRAIHCAHALGAAWAARGGRVRLGVHAGEVARGSRGLVGEGVATARALAQAAAPGEVWVSRVVRDLVHGSPLRFEPRAALSLEEEGRSLEVLASLPPAPSGQETVRKREGP